MTRDKEILVTDAVAARDALIAEVRKRCRNVYRLFPDGGGTRWVAEIQYPEYHQHHMSLPAGMDCLSDDAKQLVIAYLLAHQVRDAAEFAVFLHERGNVWLGRKWGKRVRRYLNDDAVWIATWDEPDGLMFLGYHGGKWAASFEEVASENTLPESGVGCDPLTAVESLAAAVRKYGESWTAGADQILLHVRGARDSG